MKKIVKFGGSSLANAEQFQKVGEIIRSDESRRYVVPSAPGKRFDGDTKVTDLLYKCYNTFYNPGNMILFVVGDLDAEEVIECVRKSNHKDIEKLQEEIVRFYPEEPKEVKQKEIVQKFPISMPKFSICFKDYKVNIKGEERDDLFQVGCIGLIKALNNFNTQLNVRFSTYGVIMIMGEIKRYIRDNNIIRVSRGTKDLAYKVIGYKESYQ